MVEFNRKEQYFYDPSVFLRLHPVILDSLARPENKTYFGARTQLQLNPGITQLRLPYIAPAGPTEIVYGSTFNELCVSVGTFSPGTQAPSVFLELWSSHPACTAKHCGGCTHCAAPVLAFDPSPINIGGKSEYSFSHNFMASNLPPATVCKHTWRPGEKNWGYDSPDLWQRYPQPNILFITAANRVKQALAQQSFSSTTPS